MPPSLFGAFSALAFANPTDLQAFGVDLSTIGSAVIAGVIYLASTSRRVGCST